MHRHRNQSEHLCVTLSALLPANAALIFPDVGFRGVMGMVNPGFVCNRKLAF